MTEPTDNTAQKRQRIKNLPLPPVEYLRECFEYEDETGILRWKARPLDHFIDMWRFKWWNGRFAGHEAGSKQKCKGHPSCVRVRLDGEGGEKTLYVIHRIIGALLNWEVPDGMIIDHKNGNPWDNRKDNLRIITPQQNNICRRANRIKATGLPLGITMAKNRFIATIGMNGKLHWLGSHLTVEAAVAARRKKQTELYGEDMIRPEE